MSNCGPSVKPGRRIAIVTVGDFESDCWLAGGSRECAPTAGARRTAFLQGATPGVSSQKLHAVRYGLRADGGGRELSFRKNGVAEDRREGIRQEAGICARLDVSRFDGRGR